MGHGARGHQRQRRHHGPEAAQSVDDHPGREEALLTFEILHRDERLLVIHKPAGLHVHRSAFDPDEAAVVELLEAQTGLRPLPVHRLDRPTSGVLVFALDHEASSFLGREFQEHRVDKVYHAVVRGWCPSQRVTTPVQPDRKIKQWLDAETALTLLQAYEAPWPRRGFDTFRFSLVEARPVTGRRHQIRQHLDDLRHPILGDTVWGDTALNAWWAQRCQGDEPTPPGLQLWCRSMTFDHPDGRGRVTYEAPPQPPDARRLALWAAYAVRLENPSGVE